MTSQKAQSIADRIIITLGGLIFITAGCIYGCAAQHLSATDLAKQQGAAAAASAKATGTAVVKGQQEVSQQLTTQATNATGIAQGIQTDVNAGRQATPSDGVTGLKPIWDSLWARAQSVADVSGALTTLSGKVTDLTGQVQTMNGQVDTLIDSNTQLAADAVAAKAEASAAKAAAEKATTQAAHVTALVVAFAIAAAGAAVFLAFLTKDFTIGAAGVAGAIVVIILAALLGKIAEGMGVLIDAAGWTLGVSAVLYVGDVLWRHFGKSKQPWATAVYNAIVRNPIGDIQDLIADLHVAKGAA